MQKDLYLVNFGKRLREFREQMNLSQEKFAEKTGFHRTYIGTLERGETNPSLLTLYKLAQALNIEPKDLL